MLFLLTTTAISGFVSPYIYLSFSLWYTCIVCQKLFKPIKQFILQKLLFYFHSWSLNLSCLIFSIDYNDVLLLMSSNFVNCKETIQLIKPGRTPGKNIGVMGVVNSSENEDVIFEVIVGLRYISHPSSSFDHHHLTSTIIIIHHHSTSTSWLLTVMEDDNIQTNSKTNKVSQFSGKISVFT
jgi:hypothetical protein